MNYSRTITWETDLHIDDGRKIPGRQAIRKLSGRQQKPAGGNRTGAKGMLVFMAVTDSDAHVRRQESVQIDETLLQRIGAGEKEAFLSLYEQVSNAVFAYALSLVKNRADAEDIMQDTFLKIRSAAHLYEPMGKPMAWILTITRNLCMMHFRKAKHIGDEKPEDLQISLGTDRIRETEDRIVLETAFRILSDEERKIIILHAVSGMRHREIADLMEMPLATVLSKYNRGLKKLKKELEGKV